MRRDYHCSKLIILFYCLKFNLTVLQTKELIACLNEAEYGLTDKQVTIIQKLVDFDKTGQLNKEEFLSLCSFLTSSLKVRRTVFIRIKFGLIRIKCV